MKIYDITQELFSCAVYSGDPTPKKEVKLRIADGAVCNLTAFEMCAHNGTHVDAPYHFYENGKTIDQVDLERFVGNAYVAEHSGLLQAEDVERIRREAAAADIDGDAAKRIRGMRYLSEEQ